MQFIRVSKTGGLIQLSRSYEKRIEIQLLSIVEKAYDEYGMSSKVFVTREP